MSRIAEIRDGII